MLRVVQPIICAVLAFFCAFYPESMWAAMTSANYQIQWDSVGVGGLDTSSSSSYVLRDIVGGLAVGSATSSAYQLTSGYRSGVTDQVAAFQVYAQNKSTQVAATALSSNIATVTSVTGYAVGDWIVVIQDEGDGQIAAVGEITSISSPSITVDFLATNGTTPAIDGSNDYVYELDSSSVALGALTTSAVATGVVAWEVTADVAQGYSVYAYEDGDFRVTDSVYISDVGDGDVSAGSAEYGVRSSDVSLASSTADTADIGLTTSLTQVASRSDNSFSSRDFLTINVGIGSATASGSYGHTVTLVYVGDY